MQIKNEKIFEEEFYKFYKIYKTLKFTKRKKAVSRQP